SRPVFGQNRNACGSNSASEYACGAWYRASSAGASGLDTSNSETCVPVRRPWALASWPTPMSRLSPAGCRYAEYPVIFSSRAPTAGDVELVHLGVVGHHRRALGHAAVRVRPFALVIGDVQALAGAVDGLPVGDDRDRVAGAERRLGQVDGEDGEHGGTGVGP